MPQGAVGSIGVAFARAHGEAQLLGAATDVLERELGCRTGLDGGQRRSGEDDVGTISKGRAGSAAAASYRLGGSSGDSGGVSSGRLTLDA